MDARSGGSAVLTFPPAWVPAEPPPEPGSDTDRTEVVTVRVAGHDGRPAWLVTVTADLASAVRRRLRKELPELDSSLRAVAAGPAGQVFLPWIDLGDARAPRPYLVCPRTGATFADDLAARGPLPAAYVVPVALTAIDALRVLHRHGRAHGWLGPAGLHHEIHRGGSTVRLFAPLPPSLAELLALAGGTGHEAPEVLRGGEASPAADVFALASTAWTLLSGRPPFGAVDDQLARLTAAEPPPLNRADVPDAMESALRAALAPDPSRRPDLDTLSQALLIVVSGSAPVSQAGSLPPDTGRQDTLEPTRPVGDELGRPLGSRYLLDALIGRGATGHVWRGHQRDDGAAIAVKLLRSDLAEDPEVVTRFMRERTALTRIAHPNLVAVHDLVAEGGALAIVMDLVDGRDLRTVLASGPLPLTEAARLLAQTGGALAAVHAAGFVHRDMKPENVIVERDGSTTRARLTDFGLARAVESSHLTRATQLVGTPAYIAPEVVAGREPTPAVDVYALGIAAYESLAGRRPFTADSAAALLRAHLDETPVRPDGVDDATWSVIAACLAKEPERRPTAQTLAAAWGRIAAGEDPGPLPAAVNSSGLPFDAPTNERHDVDYGYAAGYGDGYDPDYNPDAADDEHPPTTTPAAASGASSGGSTGEQWSSTTLQPTTGAQRPLAARHAPPRAEHKGRRKLWLIVAAAVIVLGFGGGYAVVALNKDEPKQQQPKQSYPIPAALASDPTQPGLLAIRWTTPAGAAGKGSGILVIRTDHSGKQLGLLSRGQLPSSNQRQLDIAPSLLPPGQCVVVLVVNPTSSPPKGVTRMPKCRPTTKSSAPTKKPTTARSSSR